MKDFVYRVMKNLDTTEGRGPMIYVVTIGTFEAADAYVKSKQSPFWTPLTAKCIVEGHVWSYDGWYEIHKDEVFETIDAEKIEAERKELEELEERVIRLRVRLKNL